MDWTAAKIADLRKRLGWTVPDLARRLGCLPKVVVSWEAGQATPERDHVYQLEYLFIHLESSAEQIRQRPLADKLMKDRGLHQINSRDVEILSDEE